MSYSILDNEELLRLALEAMNAGKDADSVVMLKTLIERDPENSYGQYLLAAQYAQMGLMDRAESGFRTAVAGSVEIPMARFQLGQLLLLKGNSQDARTFLAPLLGSQDPALASYAGAMTAAADEALDQAIDQLRAGLALPQAIPALAADMQRLLGNLEAVAAHSGKPADDTSNTPAAAMYLSNYGRQH